MMSEKIRKVMRGEQGFTLVEMMVVLIIIAVLIGFGIRAYMGYIASSKITKAKGDISTMSAALDSYYAQNQGYPGTDDGSLVSAGLSTVEVSGTPTTGVPYVIATDANGYVIYTEVRPDGNNWVVATGSQGITSLGPYLTTLNGGGPPVPPSP